MESKSNKFEYEAFLEIQDIETLEDNYYTYDESYSILRGDCTDERITSYFLPKHLKIGKFKDSLKCYSKVDVDKILEEKNQFSLKHIDNSSKYIHTVQIQEKLGITGKNLSKIRKEFNLQIERRLFYLRSDIEHIYKLQQSFFEEYTTFEEIEKILSRRCIRTNLETYKVPVYAQGPGSKFYKRTSAYKKSDVEELILSGKALESYYKDNNIKISAYSSVEEYNDALDNFIREHYTHEKVLGILNDEYMVKATPINVPNEFRRKFFKHESVVYNKKEIDELMLLQVKSEINNVGPSQNHLTDQDVIKERYVKFDIACEMLNVDITRINQLCKDASLETRRVGTVLYILKSSIEKHIEEFKSYSDDYYTLVETSEFIEERYRNQIKKITVPAKFRIDKFAKCTDVYLKSDVHKAKLISNSTERSKELLTENEILVQRVTEEGYIKADIACELLGVDRTRLCKISKYASYDSRLIAKHTYILKSCIDSHLEEFKAFSDKYYTAAEADAITQGRYKCRVEWIRVPTKFRLERFTSCNYAYLKSDVDKVHLLNQDIEIQDILPEKTLNQNELLVQKAIEEGYIRFDIAKTLLGGVDRSKLTELSKTVPYRIKMVGRNTYFLKSSIENHIKEFKEFSDKYYTLYETINLIGVKYKSEIKPIPTPSKFRIWKFATSNYIYLKSDVDKVHLLDMDMEVSKESRNKYELIAQEEGYISIDTSCEMLGLERQRLLTLSKVVPFVEKKFGRSRYILKSSIENYLEEFKIFLDNHYLLYELIDLIEVENICKLKKINIPAKFQIWKFSQRSHAYLKSDVNNVHLLDTSEIVPEDITEQVDIEVTRENQYLTTELGRKQKVYKNKLTLEKLKEDGYVTVIVASEMLGISQSKVYKMATDAAYDTIVMGKSLYILKSSIENHLKEFEDFSDTHYTLDEASQLIKNRYVYQNIVDIPPKFKMGKFNVKNRACLKSTVDKLYSLGDEYRFIDNDRLLNEYYDNDTVAKLLQIGKYRIREILANLNINPIADRQTLLYKKVEIDKLKEQQDNFMKNYFTYDEALSQADNHVSWVNDSKLCIKIDPIYQIDRFTRCYNAYPKKEFLEYVEEKRQLEDFAEHFYSNDITSEFRNKLKQYPKDYEALSTKYPITAQLILSHWDGRLKNCSRSIKNKNALVRQSVRAVYKIYDMMEEYDVKEVYLLKTSQILKFLLKIKEKIYKEDIVDFLEYVYGIITHKLNHEKNMNKKIFDIGKIISKIKAKNDTGETLLEADIYEVDTFVELLYYCQDIELHVKNSLEDIRINTKPRYVSLWLTVSINSNNGWRIEDISNFPKIEIKDLLDAFEIFDLSWFEENTLSLEQSLLILQRLYNHQYIINKTKEYNGFYISEDLAAAVATAYSILTIYINSETIVESDEKDSISLENNIMRFFTNFNFPLNYLFDDFFRNFKVKDFKYGSNKLTSTLATLLEAVKIEDEELSKIVDNADMLMKIRSNIRGHKRVMSTLHYLNQNPEKLDSITRNLFRRGEFGYIYSTIANELGLDIKKINQPYEVDEVSLLAEITNNVWDIEIASGILNSIDEKRNSVLYKINKMDFNEILACFNDIAKNKLPSREDGVKCFVGHENCTYKKKDCFTCENAIVTVYALNAIAKGLVRLLLEYNTTDLLGEKIKLSYSIEWYTRRIKEAIDMYGEDVVFSYMQLKKDDVFCLLNPVKKVKQLLEER